MIARVAPKVDRPIDRQPDAIVEIDIGGHTHRYAAQLKRIDRFVTLGAVKNQMDHYDEPGLLVAPRITPEIAERCRELDIPFIDTAGNAYLRAPGLLVFVKGQRLLDDHMPNSGARPRAGTATALRVIFALLCKPELLNAPYREIVRAAGVALGAVGGVFLDLNGRGYTMGGQRTDWRRLVEPERLFEEWVTNYPIRLRPKLNPKRFRAATPDWWQQFDVTEYGALWGGEVAADKLTRYLKPATFTLYVRPDNDREALARLVAVNRLRADPNGDIEIIEAFWNFPPNVDHPDIVPPILVYADLVATLDPRNLQTAKLIRERYIDRDLRQG
ncbi:MAG: type IV toxin-antitoxin system AbiEi family antitoxin [Acidiferrobacterales bacterium]